jgi:hypothetical protein
MVVLKTSEKICISYSAKAAEDPFAKKVSSYQCFISGLNVSGFGPDQAPDPGRQKVPQTIKTKQN